MTNDQVIGIDNAQLDWAHKTSLTPAFYDWSACPKRGRKLEDTEWVIRSRKSKKDRQYNDQKKSDKQQSTKHYTEHD